MICYLFPLLALQVIPNEALQIALPSAFTGNTSVPLDETPLGVSIEFFTWPEYNKLPGTYGCLEQLASLTDGQMPPIRIGGTTQDRAMFDPDLTEAVAYYVANSTDAPLYLTRRQRDLDTNYRCHISGHMAR